MTTGAALAASDVVTNPFPVTIETQFGPAVINHKPRRIVSLGYTTQDSLLALGEIPVAVRDWYGGQPFGIWPWAQDELGDAQPSVIRGEINAEQIAALRPDLIVAYGSGITARDYAILSRIAPTLAPAPGETSYGTRWQDGLLRIGRATGNAAKAMALIARLESRLAAIRAAHPAWAGRTMAIAMPSVLGAYTDEDPRGKLAIELGFELPSAFSKLKGAGTFFVHIPREDPSALDADILVWLDASNKPDLISDIALRDTFKAHREGREIYADAILSAALSFSSPLSLDYALDRFVPMIEAAIDGNPETPVVDAVKMGIAP